MADIIRFIKLKLRKITVMEKNTFEKEGLKIEGKRLLTYSQLSCPLDCKYCFVEDLNFNQKRRVAYLSEKQFSLLSELPEEINIVMLDCDTEFFQDRQQSIKILKRLVELKRDISVVTKLSLPVKFIEELSNIEQKLNTNGNFLIFSMSIPTLNSATIWEPKAPVPLKRIETLKTAFELGIKTLIAIRPLLPSIPTLELEDIVTSSKDFCYGFYSGPLYLKEIDSSILGDSAKLKIEKIQPSWMPKGNIFYKIEKEGQMQELRDMIKKQGKLFFEGAADAIDYLRNNAKH